MAEHQRKAAPPPRLPGARFLVVEARYYDDVGEMLMQGARAAFAAAGADFDVIGVPDALEIPAAIAIANDARPYDSTMALGCVIRGEAYYKDRCRASRGDNPIPTCARSPAEKNSI